MKKVLKVISIIASVLMVLAVVLVIWQWGNVKALFISLNSSQEQISTLIEQNNIKTNEVLNEITDTQLRPLSDEERKKLETGELSKEEAVEKISGYTDNVKTQDKVQSRKEVDEIISEIYLLRAEYLNALDLLVGEAKSAYRAIPGAERTLTRKAYFAETYTGRAAALEKQCDSKMNNLLSQLKVALEKENKDLKVISEIKSLYNSEKELKKSELINKYSKYRK